MVLPGAVIYKNTKSVSNKNRCNVTSTLPMRGVGFLHRLKNLVIFSMILTLGFISRIGSYMRALSRRLAVWTAEDLISLSVECQ